MSEEKYVTKKRKRAKTAVVMGQQVIVYRNRQSPSEVKYSFNNDWSAETLDDSVTGASTNFNMLRLTQGISNAQRIGNRVTPKGLSIKLLAEGSSAQSFEFDRIDFWLDTQPNASNPTWFSLYQPLTTRTDEINAPVLEAARERWKLLRSIPFNVRTVSTVALSAIATPGLYQKTIYLDLKKIQKKFKLPPMLNYSAAAAQNPDGGFNIFAIGWGTISANTTKVYMASNFSFTDD